MNKIKSVLFVAGVLLALALTFGCSDDKDPDNSGGESHSSDSSGAEISSSSGGGYSGGGSSSSENSSQSSSSNGWGSSSSVNNSQSSSSNGGSSSSSGNSSSSSLGQSSSVVLKECDVIFNPENKFCYDGIVYDKCGGEAYSPAIYICQNGRVIEAKCNNESYNPITQRCGNGVEDPCGNGWYSLRSQFCVDGIAYYKCGHGGNSYNLLTQGCIDGEIVETKCGEDLYSSKLQFCVDDKLYDKCDGMVYPPATHICQNNLAIPAKCNNESYNPLTQFCRNGTLKNYGSLIDTRDGKKYKTVVIESQTWMAENLNYAAESSKCYKSKDSYFDSNITYCGKYGRNYNWETAKAVCPSGWHLPSYKEWDLLVELAGGYKEVAAKKLKAIDGVWGDNGTDDYGFAVLSYNDGYNVFWSATERSSNGGACWYINSSVFLSCDKGTFMNVRCLQD